jgi:hypothetical protein
MVEMAVARSTGCTTSTTTADTGPTAAVIVALPATIRRNWTAPGPTAAKAVLSSPAVTSASTAGTSSRARGFRRGAVRDVSEPDDADRVGADDQCGGPRRPVDRQAGGAA